MYRRYERLISWNLLFENWGKFLRFTIVFCDLKLSLRNWVLATNWNVLIHMAASNLIEIQLMDPLCIATRGIFREKIFYIFEKLNYQCKINIIFIKSFYLNGKTKFYEIIFALLENFFIFLRIFSKPKMYVLNYFAPLMSRVR